MKCEELQYERIGDANKTYPASTLVVRKQFVDDAIAELKRENENLKDAFGGTTTAYKQVCDEYEQCDKELRATKRALWLTRAERAKEMCQRLLIQGFDPKWQEVERKCRAKAEEYK